MAFHRKSPCQIGNDGLYFLDYGENENGDELNMRGIPASMENLSRCNTGNVGSF